MILKSLPLSHLLKVTKFLVKIFHFKFLVRTEKSIFVYKIFLLNISNFKNSNPIPEKVTPSKNRDPDKPLFLKTWSHAQPPPPPSRKGGGGGEHYAS